MATYKQKLHQSGTHLSCLLFKVELIVNGKKVMMQQNQAEPHPFTALLDTGATKTYIGKGLLDHLGLKPIQQPINEQESVATASGKKRTPVNIYKGITIVFPNGLDQFSIDIRSTGAKYREELKTDYEIVIGMDILTKGIFTVSGESEYNLEFPDK